QLEKCIDEHSLENNGLYFNVSKNVPRALLAKILMEQNDYSKALVLLEEIISSKMYMLNNNRDEALSSSSTEMIYAIDRDMFPTTYFSNIIETNRYLPLVQYSEVVLLAAECSSKIGDKSKAVDYLNQIRSKDGVSSATRLTFNDDLKETWKNRMKGGFSYFQFLKRNNLAKSELDIEDYKKLFPIPNSELSLNSMMTQNPGY
ncbi:MAG: RagB/SusD family nutrient uptake outer membrane protein, partial [Bacteroidales bacterium]|nr:RagB/SusD family nutrient uptake outer membrane protein [Bacteroidales bacterium]